MGNSNAAASASAAAASGAISAAIKKEKKKAKRLGCCCCWMNIGGIIAIVVGCVLLAYFAASLSSDSDDEVNNVSKQTAKNLSYTGIAFLILGFILILIGVIIALVVYAIYRRFTGKGSNKQNFTPKTYAQGTAPYPQQDWGDVPNPHQAAGPVQPGPDIAEHPVTVDQPLITPEIKQAPPTQPVDTEAIKPEIS